jgi:hypothetical protein
MSQDVTTRNEIAPEMVAKEWWYKELKALSCEGVTTTNTRYAVFLALKTIDELAALQRQPERAPPQQMCGACGQPWTGEPCGQKDNGWPFQTCTPVPEHPPSSEADPANRHGKYIST